MKKSKISITLDSGIFGLQKYGGISNYWKKLIEFMQNNDSFDLNILLPSNILSNDIKNIAIKSKSSYEFMSPKINRYLKADVKETCEIFHSSYYRLPKDKSSLRVISVYDFTYEYFSSGIKKLVHSYQKLDAIKKADEVICISESTKNDVIKFLPSLDISKLHVIHLAVDHSNFFPDKIEKKYQNTVLFVGQRTKYKRFDLAVEAIKYNKNFQLGIIGPKLRNDEREYLNLNIKNNWEYFGELSIEDLRKAYSSSFAFIFPSDYEGFGLPILEAMACGCPVLSSNISSLPEVGGAAALYAKSQCPKEYSEKLDEIIDCRESLISKGHQRVKDFSWKLNYEQTISIYKKGLKRKQIN